jgi:hypothetical protein
LLLLKLLLGELIRRHAQAYLQKHLSTEPQKKQLDTILGQNTPSHFMSPHLMNEFSTKVKSEPEISNVKLDSIDRFTMVKSRIV